MRRLPQILLIAACVVRLDGADLRSRPALRLDGAEARSGQAQPTPILVELFTSEGCSDCPPADLLLDSLQTTQPVSGAEVIGLGQHVDYWDRQGWKDRFSSVALTNRQQVYGARFNLDSVYTPQMVVDGRAQFVGNDGGAARKALERALSAPHGVLTIAIEPAANAMAVAVRATGLPPVGRGDRADIVVAVTEDHLRSVVTRGENHGRTLTHAAVVRSMAVIGQAADGGASARAEIPLAGDWQRDQLKVVAFVQEQRGRAILASAMAPLQIVRR
jgi:hypothetical protein